MAMFLGIYPTCIFWQFRCRPEQEPVISGRATLATQSHFLGTWVFVTNFTYNRIITDYPEMNYILTLTHTVNPLWSVYLETQGYSSDIYKDQIFRTGVAYLFTDDIQLEATIGANTKDTLPYFLSTLEFLIVLIFIVTSTQKKRLKKKPYEKKRKA